MSAFATALTVLTWAKRSKCTAHGHRRVYGRLISPKNDTNIVYRSFTGEGSRIIVTWDGLNGSGQQISAQMLAAVIYDLGEGTEPEPENGGSATNAPPGFDSVTQVPGDEAQTVWYPKTASAALANGWTSFFVAQPPMPPVKVDGKWFPWEVVFGAAPLREVQITLKQQEQFAAKSRMQAFGGASPSSPAGDSPARGFVFSYPFAHKALGTAGVFWQGHHPWLFPNNRPPRGLPYG